MGNGVGDQPVNDLYVFTFSRMMKSAFRLISPSTSSVGLSYLVCRPENHEAWCQRPTIPAATNTTHPCRFWRDLLPRASCVVDFLSMSIQRPIRDVRHGQPIMPCSSMRMITLNAIADYQVTPIISITFYMVILRVGLAARASRTMTSILLGNMSTANSLSAERRRRTEVHITSLTENKVDEGQCSLMSSTRRVSNKNSPREPGFDGEGAVV